MLPEFERSFKIFEDNGLTLTQELYKKLDIYAEFLVEYNNYVNLTAILKPEEILVKHFADSIRLAELIEIPENSSVIDVGTGAGFPSVPLKLYRPDLKITLLDSLQKRIIFLQKLANKLDIDAEFVHDRAENASKLPEFRERFDVASARAVANMALLSELCIPFVKVGGVFAAMKGPGEDLTLGYRAIDILGGKVEKEIDYTVGDEGRKLAIVKKISHTSPKYPRNSAQIKKKTL